MTPSFQMNSCINPYVVDRKFLNKKKMIFEDGEI
jgi:hypothetical protein